ncbi:pentapeptide repeat-containing protein [Thermostichus vulcanus]|nr:pentapeptide repeat-containing protein [Thermostichus vulcanus]
MMFAALSASFLARTAPLTRLFRGILVFLLMIGLLMILFGSPAQAEDYTKRDLQGMNFAGQDLTGSKFLKANLRQSDLSHVKAAGVNLFGANLSKANLQGADLRSATLDMANLQGADLREAQLQDSMMWLARVDGIQIEGADFTNALIRQDALSILCERATGVNPVTGRATRDTLECE